MSIREPADWEANCDICYADACDLWEYGFESTDDVIRALTDDYEWTYDRVSNMLRCDDCSAEQL